MARKAKLKELEVEAADVEAVAAEIAAAVGDVEVPAVPSVVDEDGEEPDGEVLAKVKPKAAKAGKATKAPAKSNLATARALLGKVFTKEKGGTDEVLTDENRFKVSMPHLPTGSVILNYIIGGSPNKFGVLPCPGFPRARVVNIYGMESSGKTTLCLQLAAETIRNGGTVCYIDWEHAVDVAYAKALGVPMDDPDSFLLVQPPTFEKGLSILWTMVRAGVDLVVVDSVGSGATQAQWEKKIEEAAETGRVGAKAAQWSEFFPKLKALMSRTNSCVVGISQLRAKINTGPASYGGPQTSEQGGNAWKFFSEVRISLKKIQTEKGLRYDALTNTNVEVPIGNVVMVKIDKCKVSSAQGTEARVYIRFGEGIDNLRSIIEVACARGVVKKSGAWFNWDRKDGSLIKGQGGQQFRELILSTKGAQAELTKATLASLAAARSNTVAVQEEEDADAEALSEILDVLDGSAPGEKKAAELTEE